MQIQFKILLVILKGKFSKISCKVFFVFCLCVYSKNPFSCFESLCGIDVLPNYDISFDKF